MPEATAKPLLLLVDGHSLAFRSFYAFSKGGEGGLATKDGRPTSVTYGFLKALLDNSKTLKPEGVAIAFDTAEPTFRHKADANYKAHRDVAPEVFFQDLEQLQQISKRTCSSLSAWPPASKPTMCWEPWRTEQPTRDGACESFRGIATCSSWWTTAATSRCSTWVEAPTPKAVAQR